jgi:hypothetical protein
LSGDSPPPPQGAPWGAARSPGDFSNGTSGENYSGINRIRLRAVPDELSARTDHVTHQTNCSDVGIAPIGLGMEGFRAAVSLKWRQSHRECQHKFNHGRIVASETGSNKNAGSYSDAVRARLFRASHVVMREIPFLPMI